jgi:hypothetical protein
MKRSSIILLCSSALLCLLITSACSHKLSRGKAKELLLEKGGFPRPVTETWQCGEVSYFGDGSRDIAKQHRYVDGGLVTFTPIGTNPGMGGLYTVFRMTFPTKAQGYVVQMAPDHADVRMADLVFGNITGIREAADGKEAAVDFTLKYDNLTPFGNARNATDADNGQPETYDKDKVMQMHTRLVKYDDGWRT